MATSFTFTPDEVAALKAEAAASEAGGGIDFCAQWPVARQVLQALQGMLSNPIAKGAIGIVIAAGNALCPGG